MDLSESGFAVLRILFASGYSVWINQKVDLPYLEYCLYMDRVCSSTREWICCNLDSVHILELKP